MTLGTSAHDPWNLHRGGCPTCGGCKTGLLQHRYRTDRNRGTSTTATLLRLTQDLFVLWQRDPTMGDDLMLPEGTPVRDPKRVGESELLGAEWQFEAGLDGGKTWRAFATIIDLELRFPAE